METSTPVGSCRPQCFSSSFLQHRFGSGFPQLGCCSTKDHMAAAGETTKCGSAAQASQVGGTGWRRWQVIHHIPRARARTLKAGLHERQSGSHAVGVRWELLCKNNVWGWQDQHTGLHSTPALDALRMLKRGSFTLDSALWARGRGQVACRRCRQSH